jgi:hypothetical protein
MHRLAGLPETDNGVHNIHKTYSQLSGGQAAAAATAVKKFRLWKESYFLNSNASANESDGILLWPPLLHRKRQEQSKLHCLSLETHIKV